MKRDFSSLRTFRVQSVPYSPDRTFLSYSGRCRQSVGKSQKTIFRQAMPPYSLPEAIHPSTGGGTMGDGHHGWAAAEITLFLRSCMVKEENGVISLFKGNINRLVQKGKNIKLKNVPTTSVKFHVPCRSPMKPAAVIHFEGNFDAESLPAAIEINLPFAVKNAAASSPNHISAKTVDDTTSLIRCSPKVRTLFLKLLTSRTLHDTNRCGWRMSLLHGPLNSDRFFPNP